MDRNSTNPRQASAARGPQTRELTEAELNAVSGSAVDAFNVAHPTASIPWSGGGGAGDTAVIAII